MSKRIVSNSVSRTQIEQEIYDYYQWFSVEAPLVTPSETGKLGELWDLFDQMVE